MMETDNRSTIAKRVTFVGAGFNLFLAIIKIVFGWLGRSSALIADGVHSFSDLITDALVILASHFGSRKADVDHPYGHQRIETAATLFLAMLLILAGLGIIYDALIHLISGDQTVPKDYVLWVIILSILINEGLYHYTRRAGEKIQSSLIIANAWHHRSDAASSLVVLVGVLGALMGYLYFDSIAAFIVGIMIVKMGTTLGWSSVKELIDTGVPQEILAKIESSILSVPGVVTLHELRTRCMAETIFVDAHILVNPRITVSEGHYIADRVRENLLTQFEKIVDVTIHVDPENDEVAAPSRHLPPRTEIVAVIMSHLAGKEIAEAVSDIRLHYLDGEIQVELVFPIMVLEEQGPLEKLREQYIDALSSIHYISNIQLIFI